MADDILPIGMNEMNRIFEIVDDLEVSREAIQVELLREGAGSVEALASGKIRIVLPESTSLDSWLPSLRQELENIAPTPENAV